MKPTFPKQQNEAVAAFLACVDTVETLPKGIPALAATRVLQGRVHLYLPAHWNDYSDACKREILSHECAHVVLKHTERFCSKDHEHKVGLEMEGCHPDPCEREIRLWQCVTDAVLNKNGCADYELVDREVGSTSITFERLGLPATKAEIAYELLRDKRDKEQPQGCGSMLFSRSDMSPESWERLESMAQQIGQLMAGAGGTRRAGPITGTIPPPPPWISKILDRLLYTGGRHVRKRSWRRPNKQVPDLVPGYTFKQSLDALFLLDASGSIDDQLLLTLFSAVCSVPELAHSKVVVFDHEVSDVIPASDGKRVLEVASSKRGGTCIQLAGKARISGIPAVWLTDAESGDGMPDEHDALELWVVAGRAEVPGREVIRVEG